MKNDKITVKMRYEIGKRIVSKKNPHEWFLKWYGTAGPNVSGGTPFGGGSTHATKEEADKSLDQIAIHTSQFFQALERPVVVELNEHNAPEIQIMDVFK